MSAVKDTMDFLENLRKKTDKVLIAYSGGKDSLVVLDLAVKVFPRVECFCLYFVPDLAITEERLQYARDRYKVLVHQFPGISFINGLVSGTYCKQDRTGLQPITLVEAYELARFEVGIHTVLTGMKKADYTGRMQIIKSMEKRELHSPIKWWTKNEVITYLKMKQIEVPEQAGERTKGARFSGLNLNRNELLWLHDNHPDDWKKLLEYFPFAEAVVYHRKWYKSEPIS